MEAQHEKAKIDSVEIIITIVVVALLIGGSYLWYQFDRNKKFEALADDGHKHLFHERYVEAMDSFSKALAIREDGALKSIYNKADRLNTSREYYRSGLNFLEEGLLSEAIDAFQVVSPESNSYLQAQELLEESQILFTDVQIEIARGYYKGNEFLQALETIRSVLHINPEYKIALALEEQIITAYNKEEERVQKEIEEQIIRLHDEARKQSIENIKDQMSFFEQDFGPIGIAVTQVNAVDKLKVGFNTLSFQDKQSHFLWIYVVVRNEDSKANYIDVRDFTLSLVSGFTYNIDKNMHTFTNIFESINLPAGNTSGGWMLFSARKSDRYILNYNSPFGSARKEIILH